VVSLGEVLGENVFMQWTDVNPVKVNYIAVMTGWGSEGYWEFSTVENPRVIKLSYSVDTDHCLWSRDDWGESYTCANSESYCTSTNAVWK
jgi:hypothetical protein